MSSSPGFTVRNMTLSKALLKCHPRFSWMRTPNKYKGLCWESRGSESLFTETENGISGNTKPWKMQN